MDWIVVPTGCLQDCLQHQGNYQIQTPQMLAIFQGLHGHVSIIEHIWNCQQHLHKNPYLGCDDM